MFVVSSANLSGLTSQITDAHIAVASRTYDTRPAAYAAARYLSKSLGRSFSVEAKAPNLCDGCGQPVLDGDFSYCADCHWHGTQGSISYEEYQSMPEYHGVDVHAYHQASGGCKHFHN